MAKRVAKSEAKEPVPGGSGEIVFGPACRVAIFHGPEAYLRNGFTDQLKTAIEQAGNEVQVIRFDGVTAQPVDVLDECRSMALLAAYKMVIVDDADQFITPKKFAEELEDSEKSSKRAGPVAEEPSDALKEVGKRRAMLERYVQAPCDNVTLVLRAETWRKGNLDKYAQKVGVVKDCAPLEEGRVANWTAARSKQKYGRAIEVAAVELLVSSLNRDMARIDAELAKLSGASKEGESISADLVERLVAPAAQERKPWEISEFLFDSNPAGAMEKLHELIDRCGIDPVPLRWACIDTATKLHAVSQEIARGVAPAAAGKSIKFFFGTRLEGSRRVGKNAGPRVCAALLRECIDADWRAKTGQGDPVHGLEALVLAFSRASALHAGGAAGR